MAFRRSVRRLAGGDFDRSKLYRPIVTPKPGDKPYMYFDMKPPFAGDFMVGGGMNNFYWRFFRTRPQWALFTWSYVMFIWGAFVTYNSYQKPEPKPYIPPRDMALTFLPDLKHLPDFFKDPERGAKLADLINDPKKNIQRVLEYYQSDDPEENELAPAHH